MRIVICDDNASFGNELTEYVKNFTLTSSIFDDEMRVEYVKSPQLLVDMLLRHEVDILLLDIAMPEIGGFDIAKVITENSIKTTLIFVSSFENNVFYSLRYKPFRFIRKSSYTEEIPEALKSAYSDLTLKNRVIMITKHSDAIPVRLSRIIYAEKEKRSNYMAIYTVDDTYRFRGTLSDFEALTNKSGFVRASQNAYINMEHIIKIQDGTVFLTGEVKYYLSAKYRSTVMQEFFKFMREE